jgi:hypothetical protein
VVALRLQELATLKDAVKNLHNLYPDLAAMMPCYLNMDHAIIDNVLQCAERSPFPNILSSIGV